MGRLLGVIAKLGPWASRDTWVSMMGASNRFFTHLSGCTIVVVVVVVFVAGTFVNAVAGDVIGEDTDTASDAKSSTLYHTCVMLKV